MDRKISEEKVDEYRAKYGRVEHVTYNGYEIVFRQPKRGEAANFMIKVGQEGQKHVADEQLALFLVLQVDNATDQAAREKLGELYEIYPLMTKSKKVGDAIARLLGISEEEDAKT